MKGYLKTLKTQIRAISEEVCYGKVEQRDQKYSEKFY